MEELKTEKIKIKLPDFVDVKVTKKNFKEADENFKEITKMKKGKTEEVK